jgi:hypothetical protein
MREFRMIAKGLPENTEDCEKNRFAIVIATAVGRHIGCGLPDTQQADECIVS